jgi:predicted HTH domain antitoxin
MTDADRFPGCPPSCSPPTRTGRILLRASVNDLSACPRFSIIDRIIYGREHEYAKISAIGTASSVFHAFFWDVNMTPKVPFLTLSPGLREEFIAVTEAGLYDSAEAVVADAVRTFLAARPDLREAIACRLHARGVFSLGRAAEWSGLSVEMMKAALHRAGVVRQADAGPSEIEAMAREILHAAGRAVR